MNKLNNESSTQNKIITVPNLLSFLRLCLIPLFIWLYCIKQNYNLTILVLLLSGATDIVDGVIARHFNMISDFGKILDPVADKLTQAAMLFCLLTRFPLMIVPLSLMILKELFMGVTGLMVIKKTGNVYGANWHGKVATCLLYTMMILHLVWHDIPPIASDISVAVCIFMMILSMVLYGIRNLKTLRDFK